MQVIIFILVYFILNFVIEMRSYAVLHQQNKTRTLTVCILDRLDGSEMKAKPYGTIKRNLAKRNKQTNNCDQWNRIIALQAHTFSKLHIYIIKHRPEQWQTSPRVTSLQFSNLVRLSGEITAYEIHAVDADALDSCLTWKDKCTNGWTVYATHKHIKVILCHLNTFV